MLNMICPKADEILTADSEILVLQNNNDFTLKNNNNLFGIAIGAVYEIDPHSFIFC